jgi:hypothetical protein
VRFIDEIERFLQVMEEVGFDMKDRAFDDQYLERDLNGQLIRLYIVKQVPLETKFAAKTKNEIKVRVDPMRRTRLRCGYF